LEASAELLSIGNVAVDGTQAGIRAQSTVWREASGPNSAATATDAVISGWNLTTGRFRNSGSNHISTIFANQKSVVGNTASNAIALTNFTTLRIGDRVSSAADNTTNVDVPIAYVAFGRGNPAAAHEWAYNGGRLRRISDYNFSTDPNGATLDGFIPLYRVNPGNTTFVIGNVIDTIGAYDSWSLTGSLAMASRKPGFINPAGDPPATPATYVDPMFARTDEPIVMCANTLKSGDANQALFTWTSIVHSTLGDISGSFGGTPPVISTPGTITFTGLIYNGGSPATFTCEVIEPLALSSAPQFYTRYGGNALAAQIEPYTSPGTGTTYANVAALATGINALASGGTLIVEDLSAAGDVLTLTTANKNYGGATIVCRNRHGVVLSGINLNGAQNLTLRGFSGLSTGFFSKDGTGDSGSTRAIGGSIVIDHCTGKHVTLSGATGAAETVTVSNWIGPDDGTATSCNLNILNRATIRRFAHGNTTTSSGDVLRTDRCNTIIADRFFLGFTGNNNPAAHIDGWQTYQSGSTGVTGGLIQNGVVIDKQETGETGAQGVFLTGIVARHLRVNRCLVDVPLSNAIAIGPSDQGCAITDTTATGSTTFHVNSANNSGRADNNVRGGTAAILPASGVGDETGTTNVTSFATVYPDFAAERYTWKAFADPTTPGIGADALVVELLASEAGL